MQERLNVNYKDAPPDIQRQIEALMGLQPSQMPSLAEQNMNIKAQQAGMKTEKTRQDMALNDVTTSLQILNDSKQNGSKEE